MLNCAAGSDPPPGAGADAAPVEPAGAGAIADPAPPDADAALEVLAAAEFPEEVAVVLLQAVLASSTASPAAIAAGPTCFLIIYFSLRWVRCSCVRGVRCSCGWEDG